jgi:prenylated cyclic peptide (anacyclamide/piricyclamide family)
MTKKNLKPQQAAPVQREIKGNQYHFLGYVAPTIAVTGVYSFCGRRCGVIPLILTLTSKSVKSLFPTAKAHGSPL